MLCDHLALTRFQLDDLSVCCKVSVGARCREALGWDVSGLTEFICLFISYMEFTNIFAHWPLRIRDFLSAMYDMFSLVAPYVILHRMCILESRDAAQGSSV